MKRLKAQQIRDLLHQAGFRSHPGIEPPRPSRRFKPIPTQNPPSHTIWAKTLGAVWWGTLTPSDDFAKLSDLARETGEQFYVFTGPTPSTRPFPRAAERLVWWTRNGADDEDRFVPISKYKPGKFELPTRNYRYACGVIADEQFFKWENLVASGHPPQGAAAFEADFRCYLLFDEGKGIPVEPVFFQKSGPLELIWFSNGTPVWRKEYDIVIRRFEGVNFWKPNQLGLIRVHRGKALVALLLRAKFSSKATSDAAWHELTIIVDPNATDPARSGTLREDSVER